MTDQLKKIIDALVPIINEIAELAKIPAVVITENLANKVYNEMTASMENYKFPGEKVVVVPNMEGLKNGNS